MDKKKEIEFFIGLVQQWEQYAFSLRMNRKAQKEVGKKYGQEAEQEKKRLKVEEMSLRKILATLDAPFFAFFGKSIEGLFVIREFQIKEKPRSPEEESNLTYDEFVEAFNLSLRTSRESVANAPDMSK